MGHRCSQAEGEMCILGEAFQIPVVGDFIPRGVVLVLNPVGILLLSPTWLGKELFDLQTMSSVWDYLIVLGTAAIFGLLLKTFWRFRVFDRYMRIETQVSPDV